MNHPDDSFTKLSVEEQLDLIKRTEENFKSLDLTKFYDCTPEYLSVFFETLPIFEKHFIIEDLKILHDILGTPFTISPLPKDNYYYSECFKNLQVANFVRLIKAFTISFNDFSTKPHIAAPDSAEWIHENKMESVIYQRNPFHEVSQITDTLPLFILEPPDLYIQFYNNTGSYRIPLDETPPGWDHKLNWKVLQGYREYIGCDISKISIEKDRWKVDITTTRQFIRLLRCIRFIHKFNPQTDVVSLILVSQSCR